MRSIVYAGNDFSDVCSAEVVARSANPIIAEYMRVPGRAGRCSSQATSRRST